MKLSILIENVSHDPHLCPQEGLSILIQYRGRNILFDMGADGAFAENAEKMGVDLHRVDLGVLSHAHYDHAGGIEAFFEKNESAPLYLKRQCTEEIVAALPAGEQYVGVEKPLFEKYANRLQYVDHSVALFDGCWIVTDFVDHDRFGIADRRLGVLRDGRCYPDDFAHEQALVLEEADGLTLVTGCSHSGIGNIVDAVKESFPDKTLQHIVGGFHIGGPPHFTTLSTTPEELSRLGDKLMQDASGTIYTFHCTGLPPYELLKQQMEDRLGYLSTGETIEL